MCATQPAAYFPLIEALGSNFTESVLGCIFTAGKLELDKSDGSVPSAGKEVKEEK